MKKLFAILVSLALLLSLAVCAAEAPGPIGLGTMFVYTQNGKTLNVRSSPDTGDNIIGHLKYGAQVNVTHFEGSWARIDFADGPDGSAWVQKRFLQWYAPGPKPTPKPDEDQETNRMNAELRSEAGIDPIPVEAHATRASGWVNMRQSPSKDTRRIQTCSDGTVLTAFAETTNWYHVTDPQTGNSGYIRKDFLTVLPSPDPAADETASMGVLNVHGKFQLRCKVPEGYQMQVFSVPNSTRLTATLVAEAGKSPQMMLTVAFNEMYANVERMNDLTDEELATIKESYTDMNDVEFTEGETAEGTTLLIAKETGSDEDFVSILSLYKGYSIEFVISPDPDAADHTLSDAQVQTAIDFLSNLEFIPAD